MISSISIFLCLALLFSLAPADSVQAARRPAGDTTPPTVPSGLTGTPVSSSQISLSWKASTDQKGVKGYRVYRNGAQIATTTVTTFADTGLNASTTYKYNVSAYDAAGNTSSKSSTASATTTTEPGTPTAGVIGYVGCSMTMDAVDGAISLGSADFWNTLPVYSSGGVYQWASNLNSSYWTEFQAAQDAQPTTTVWWQLCSLNSTADKETYDNALIVVNEIRRRIPDVTVYVSAQPGYNPSTHTCNIAGSTGPTRMESLANQIVKNGVAFPGPTIGPLDYPSQTVTDGCHGNDAGEEAMGQQLINFFNALQTPE